MSIGQNYFSADQGIEHGQITLNVHEASGQKISGGMTALLDLPLDEGRELLVRMHPSHLLESAIIQREQVRLGYLFQDSKNTANAASPENQPERFADLCVRCSIDRLRLPASPTDEAQMAL
ncbi:hypothetical protein AYO21_10192 [Fonsecaea monophora]|uniref:Uncharacterized protein n=1 Tax=Fonsecaea monophora TaxID=254056 RepID=A0A177EX79_9EURO|nr:hypothetical protein AYO21_10192 [Fonsecaea monophora]OAG35652.1 hypothetical protein AYO21_10192 [Fonsecaea monophora]